MNIELILIGNELLSGAIADANAFFMTGTLTEKGFAVTRICMVGDEEERICESLLRAGDRADAVIVSGGLGPTTDDLTTSAAAKAFGDSLIFHKEVLERIPSLFAQRNMEMPQSNEKQAVFPSRATIIPNPAGTAPGFFLRFREKLFFFLPGVPRELRRLFRESVLPRLEGERKEEVYYQTRTLKIFGLTESAIADRLRDVRPENFSASLAYLPRYPENHVKITVKGPVRQEAERNIRDLETIIRERLKDRVFAVDEDTLEEIVGRLLRKHKATLAVAESCTGGLVAHRLTNVPGSSDYFERGVVVYSNRAKNEILQVPEEMIAALGAVSGSVAEKMAEGVRRISQATLGLGITGIAGPSGGSEEKPVGTVFIALADPGGATSKKYQFLGDRKRIKAIAAQTALDRVRRHLLKSEA